MKIVYLTMEYHHQFSGNGTASMSFVRALRGLGVEVYVVCGGDEANGRALTVGEGVCVSVAEWGHHGRSGPWEAWGAGMAGGVELPFTPDVVIGVDWEANLAYTNLVAAGTLPADTPYVYYNYRVFHRNTGNTPEDTAFYSAMERKACALAHGRVLCLCDSDKAALEQLTSNTVSPVVLLPGLREDMRCLRAPARGAPARKYLLCCVRIIPEKNIQLFIDILKVPKLADALRAAGLVPYMIGSAASREYGEVMKAQLLETFPGAVTSDFVPSAELQEIMRQSVLNVHPALNEAYGMTIVEAAAVGCSTVVHVADIGAASLLLPAADEVFVADMRDPAAVAGVVCNLLEDRARLDATAERAMAKALSYGERENAEGLLQFLVSVVGQGAAPASL